MLLAASIPTRSSSIRKNAQVAQGSCPCACGSNRTGATLREDSLDRTPRCLAVRALHTAWLVCWPSHTDMPDAGSLLGNYPRHCLPRACSGSVQDLPGADLLQRVHTAALPGALGRCCLLTDAPCATQDLQHYLGQALSAHRCTLCNTRPPALPGAGVIYLQMHLTGSRATFTSSIAFSEIARLAFSCILQASCRAVTSSITALGHAHGHESSNLLLRSMRRLLLLWRRCLPRRLWHVDRRCIGRAALAVWVEEQHLHQEEVQS